MGLPVVRLGIDICTGHPSGTSFFTARPASAGSPDVLVDGIPAVRVGDEWAPHTDQKTSHTGQGITGSPTVLCNGQPLMRIADVISCGSTCAMGSPTTFSG